MSPFRSIPGCRRIEPSRECPPAAAGQNPQRHSNAPPHQPHPGGASAAVLGRFRAALAPPESRLRQAADIEGVDLVALTDEAAAVTTDPNAFGLQLRLSDRFGDNASSPS